MLPSTKPVVTTMAWHLLDHKEDLQVVLALWEGFDTAIDSAAEWDRHDGIHELWNV